MPRQSDSPEAGVQQLVFALDFRYRFYFLTLHSGVGSPALQRRSMPDSSIAFSEIALAAASSTVRYRLSEFPPFSLRRNSQVANTIDQVDIAWPRSEEHTSELQSLR